MLIASLEHDREICHAAVVLLLPLVLWHSEFDTDTSVASTDNMDTARIRYGCAGLVL